jgi:PIN domain nuclease of toxin-antitoxin system
MNKAVLDASAILAVLFQERGAENLSDEILQGAVVSTVNLAEVQTKLVRMGHDPDKAWVDALLLETAPEPYTSERAKIAGTLAKETQCLGLSLGDRSCLALAIALKAPVYTTEQAWRNLKVGVPIHVIR